MELTGEVLNIERIFFYIIGHYINFCSMFDTSPVGSIWLKISKNWHTKSLRKKCTHFTRERIHSCPVMDTARN